MSQLYVSITGNDITGNGSQNNPYKTITKAISIVDSLSNGRIINVGPGIYNEMINVDKSVELRGCQYNNSAINSDGSIRNAEETIIQWSSTSSAIALFTIRTNNVKIDGFKMILLSNNKTRDAINLRVNPTTPGNSSTLQNIIIKNNIIQILRTASQSQSILFGESTTNSNNASNGNGVWNNVEIAYNYFDASVAGDGYRGIQFSTHFYSVTFSNIYIHHNRFIHSNNIKLNHAIGVITYITVVGRGPSYFNSFKVISNYFNTPGNSAIGELFDCDGSCEITENVFNLCKYGIYSINFREKNGKIWNNQFNTTEYSIGISDNFKATTNGYNISIVGNKFYGTPNNHIQCDCALVDFTNIPSTNNFNGYVLRSVSSTYRQFNNPSNPLLNRITRNVCYKIQEGFSTLGAGIVVISSGPYVMNETFIRTSGHVCNIESVNGPVEIFYEDK